MAVRQFGYKSVYLGQVTAKRDGSITLIAFVFALICPREEIGTSEISGMKNIRNTYKQCIKGNIYFSGPYYKCAFNCFFSFRFWWSLLFCIKEALCDFCIKSMFIKLVPVCKLLSKIKRGRV